ncbi:glycosyl transferase [Rhodovulum sp. YNF3179]|uniref:glycosyl transferase n=1 Tax=Rhodovulum sp. YNF3179 TaxID=3425127 RepID=UPI003D357615
MKQIICIKWGSKYGPDYVNRLYGMVADNITPPFRLVCFTDDTSGLRPEIETRPLPEIDYDDRPAKTFGRWPKSRLWSRDLGGLDGVVLFMDLDVVVTGSLDPFFDHGDPEDVILAYNPTTPLERMGQTSIYRMPVGKLAPLQEEFAADPQGIADRFGFEQRFVTRRAPGGVKFWPRRWVQLFKLDCIPPFPLNYVRPPRLKPGTRVVIFPGPLNPVEAIEGRWNWRYEPRAPMDHLRATFDGRRIESVPKHLRHYFLPAAWVKDYWYR